MDAVFIDHTKTLKLPGRKGRKYIIIVSDLCTEKTDFDLNCHSSEQWFIPSIGASPGRGELGTYLVMAEPVLRRENNSGSHTKPVRGGASGHMTITWQVVGHMPLSGSHMTITDSHMLSTPTYLL